ncbi:MAG: hypothetical protein ACTSPB_22350, partial [Candidatus Thorarchaeota archaeon]
MYQRYLVLALLFTSMMVLPAPTSYATTTIQSTLVTDVTLIEAQLQMAISNEKGHGASALLEFERQLTVSEINTIESTGIEFARRGSSIINVGRIYSAVVYDEESLRQISEMGLIRATSGSKQFTPSIISSMDKIRANDVWNNLEIDGQPVDGSGVTVAVIDTGAAWLHPTFWRQYPAEFDFIFDSSEYYLDLDNDAVADPNEGPILTVSGQSGPFIDYTSDYMYISTDGVGDFDYADGDRWIGGIEGDGDDYIDLISDKGVILNISKVAILYDQYTSNIYIRGVNLTQAVSVGDFI